jgi:hypothetical protein
MVWTGNLTLLTPEFLDSLALVLEVAAVNKPAE